MLEYQGVAGFFAVVVVGLGQSGFGPGVFFSDVVSFGVVCEVLVVRFVQGLREFKS